MTIQHQPKFSIDFFFNIKHHSGSATPYLTFFTERGAGIEPNLIEFLNSVQIYISISNGVQVKRTFYEQYISLTFAFGYMTTNVINRNTNQIVERSDSYNKMKSDDHRAYIRKLLWDHLMTTYPDNNSLLEAIKQSAIQFIDRQRMEFQQKADNLAKFQEFLEKH